MNKIWWLVLAVVVVAGAWWAYSNNMNLPSYVNQNQASPSPIAGAVVKPVVKKSTTPVSTQNYTELVKAYGERRIQFSDSYYGSCQATPSVPVFKNGTSILLDNRSPSAKVITIGVNKYSLIAYGYQVITLSGSNLPKELLVSCGSSVNIGKILLQAQILQ